MKLYKVLVGGKSCHGGDFTWSLPQGEKPGDWHEEATVEMCRRGFHLTDTPARWWKNGCTVFHVEAEGIQGDVTVDDRKVVARRVRLLREATDAELRAMDIYISGNHVFDKQSVIASGSASVKASGSASVKAYGSASVKAYGSASVEAYGSASVEAYDSASVEAYGSASVEASDRVVVVSWRGVDAVRIDGPRVVVVAYANAWDSGLSPEVFMASGKISGGGKPVKPKRKTKRRTTRRTKR